MYEKLGDVRSIAVTMGEIAEIYQVRGELNKALSIRQNDELPVYEKLGDVRGLLVGRTKLAMLLWQMNPEQNATQTQELLNLALTDARRLQIPEAGQIEGLMQQLGLNGDDPLNPAVLRTLENGENLYPEHYQQTTCKQLNITYFSGNKQICLWTAITLPENARGMDEDNFLTLLVASPSLDMGEKSKIISQFRQLSKQQIESLFDVLNQETEKFKVMDDEHRQELDRMQDKKLLEWLEWESALIKSKGEFSAKLSYHSSELDQW